MPALEDADATLAYATGSEDAWVHDWLIDDVGAALDLPDGCSGRDRADRLYAALSAMCDLAPRDALEGMLGAQAVAVHAAAMGCLRRAADPGAGDGAAGLAGRVRDAELRHVVRLLSLFRRQLRERDDRASPMMRRPVGGARPRVRPVQPSP